MPNDIEISDLHEYSADQPHDQNSSRATTKALVLASADSHVKWCHTFARLYAGDKAQIEIYAPSDAGHDLNQAILRNMGINAEYTTAPLADLSNRYDLSQYDVIFTILTPPLFALMHRGVARWIEDKRPDRRPIIVTGFPGISMQLVTGITTRQGADVICVNTKRDLEEAQRISRMMGYDPSPICKTGYIFAPQRSNRTFRTTPNSGRRIVFSTQPSWPSKREERKYILRKLTEAACRYPDDTFVIKLRMPPDSQTVHPEPYHYEKIFSELRVRHPRNLLFAYGPMSEALETADLHLTLASTAAVESISMGVPTAIIADFGPHNGYGVFHFIGSGLLRTIDQAMAGDVGTPEREWLVENGFAESDTIEAAFSLIEQARVAQEELAAPLPLQSLAYTPENFAYDFYPKEFLQKPRVRLGLKRIAKQVLPPAIFPLAKRVYRTLTSAR
mgnify:CR=1 FL=1